MVLKTQSLNLNTNLITIMFTCLQLAFTLQDILKYAFEKRVSRLYLQTHTISFQISCILEWLTIVLVLLANLNLIYTPSRTQDDIDEKTLVLVITYEILVYLIIVVTMVMYLQKLSNSN
jgi:uncharacterized BrkB/YihY/UPF0761 family membrane protein